MITQIKPCFTKNNMLKISFSSDIPENKYKICFSLVYSIKEIEGASVIKQIGRYYELEALNDTIFLKLQTPKTGTYNLSCGPEGLFLIDKENQLVECTVEDLFFENEIASVNYEDDVTDNFIPIIPEPLKCSFSKEHVAINNKLFKIQDEEIIRNTNEIIDKLGVKFSKTEGIPIIFKKIDNTEDEYSVIISKDDIQIYFNNYGGKFYALITLLQLIYFYDSKLPLCKIIDKPKFDWRGMHLDCARQFYSIKEIKRLLIYMSLFKMNRFHWHLTDNEAWRIEIKKYPKLTSEGAFRGYKQKIPPFYGSGYSKNGGYYSQDDIRELILYAKKLNIEIMPEVDLPAHSWTLLQVMPELKDEVSNIVSEDVGSYKNNTINPSLEKTKYFLNDILNEISNLFPFKYFHVGLDERPKNSWEGSPTIIEFMKQNNIKSQEDYQNYYINYVINILKLRDKTTAVWNEAVVSSHINHGVGESAEKIDKSCLIFSWENFDVAKETTNHGFDTVLCPGQKTYFDMAYNNSTEERGICWAGTIEVKDIFEWDPKNNIIQTDFIRGLQGQLWSETITDKNFFDKMINPRLATLSEVAWKGKITRKWIEFRSALLTSINFLKKFGWKYHNF